MQLDRNDWQGRGGKKQSQDSETFAAISVMVILGVLIISVLVKLIK